MTCIGGGNRDPWTPYAVPRSILAGWWNADDHGTGLMTDDGGGLISSWKDRINVTPANGTAAQRPTWGGAGWNPPDVNTKAAVVFDGIANGLTGASYPALPVGATPGTIIVTAKVGATAARVAAAYGTATGGVATCRVIQTVGTTPITPRLNDGVTNLTVTDPIPLNSFIILLGYWNGTTMGGRLNGADMTPATTTIAALNTDTTRLRIGLALGGSAPWLGPIRQVFVLVGAPNLALWQQFEGWLAWEGWGINNPLPPTHPYKYVAP